MIVKKDNLKFRSSLKVKIDVRIVGQQILLNSVLTTVLSGSTCTSTFTI